jgi:DNA (cytosine-5)-methyltransferase 1
MARYRAIDLFSGAGGLTLGLRKAGFSVDGAVELDPLACEAYALNFPETKLFQQDLRSLSPANLAKALNLNYGELDLLAGCPPCQSFSRLRNRNRVIATRDPASALVQVFGSFIQKLGPKCVMLENVSGMVQSAQFKKFKKLLASEGYEFIFDVLDAKDYGVPQCRKRLVLLASKFEKPSFSPVSKIKLTVRDVIGLLDEKNISRDPLHNYEANRSKKISELIALIPKDGGSRSHLPESLQLDCHKKIVGFTDIYGRMYWDRPSPTITGGCINPSRGRFLHPEKNRAITLREAALLQGFPLKYKFPLTKGYHAAAQLVGNAFPPNFATMQAKMLKKILDVNN